MTTKMKAIVLYLIFEHFCLYFWDNIFQLFTFFTSFLPFSLFYCDIHDVSFVARSGILQMLYVEILKRKFYLLHGGRFIFLKFHMLCLFGKSQFLLIPFRKSTLQDMPLRIKIIYPRIPLVTTNLRWEILFPRTTVCGTDYL